MERRTGTGTAAKDMNGIREKKEQEITDKGRIKELEKEEKGITEEDGKRY